MKKILVVIGGGRPNGNTNQLVDSFIKGALDVGHEVEKVSNPVFKKMHLMILFLKLYQQIVLYLLLHFFFGQYLLN